MRLNYSLGGHDLFLPVSFYGFLSLYTLVCEGVSDMHCMSDEYLVEELIDEQKQSKTRVSN